LENSPYHDCVDVITGPVTLIGLPACLTILENRQVRMYLYHYGLFCRQKAVLR